MAPETPRVVVIGAGIAGLSAAYDMFKRSQFERRPVEITVLEASNRIGGKIVTETLGGAIIEGGPDSFLGDRPEALELIRDLGLEKELVRSSKEKRTIFIYSGKKLRPLPDGTAMAPVGLLAFLRSGIISFPGRFRACLEPLIFPREGGEDESVSSFTRRRFGREAADAIFAPIMAGIYAGDPEKLSAQSAFPRFAELEKKGGLVRAMGKGSGAGFMTLQGGLSRLVETLALKLPAGMVKTGRPVLSVRPRNAGWEVRTAAETLSCAAVVCAIPAASLSALVSDWDFELACALTEIPTASTATVTFLFDREGFPHPLDGFGVIVPKSEGMAVSAVTFTSTKFPGRSPQGSVLLRCFIGGAGRDQEAEQDDALIAKKAMHELRQIFGPFKGQAKITRVFKWTKANPQYTLGHGLRLERIKSCLRAYEGLIIAGASYEGVGIPDCLRSGRRAAERAWLGLRRKSGGHHAVIAH